MISTRFKYNITKLLDFIKKQKMNEYEVSHLYQAKVQLLLSSLQSSQKEKIWVTSCHARVCTQKTKLGSICHWISKVVYLNLKQNHYKLLLNYRISELAYWISSQKKKPFQCNDCDASFSQKGHLNRHIKPAHKGIKSFNFKCNDCDAIFSQKENLKEHIESVHEGKKPFKCNDCDSRFSWKWDLNRHIESVHEGKKSFMQVLLTKQIWIWGA